MQYQAQTGKMELMYCMTGHWELLNLGSKQAKK